VIEVYDFTLSGGGGDSGPTVRDGLAGQRGRYLSHGWSARRGAGPEGMRCWMKKKTGGRGAKMGWSEVPEDEADTLDRPFSNTVQPSIILNNILLIPHFIWLFLN
jgi:hypothetical protein